MSDIMDICIRLLCWNSYYDASGNLNPKPLGKSQSCYPAGSIFSGGSDDARFGMSPEPDSSLVSVCLGFRV